MLELKVDYALLNRYFGLSTQKIAQYANMGFKEIMEAEAEQGNQKARDYQAILSDPNKLVEIFKLSNVENRFLILQNMSEGDIDDLLCYLTPEQLSMGLNFFTEEKLIMMCKELPTDILATMVLEKFGVEDILSLMEDNSLDKFIAQPDVERRYTQDYFKHLNQADLEKIMVHSFGEDFKDKRKEEYLEHIQGLDDNDYQNFLISMEKGNKVGLIAGTIEQNDKLIYLIDNDDIVRPMELLMKEDKIKLMKNLDPEFLIPMIQELPENLTQIVMTQIDKNDFAEILAEDFQNILSEVVLFSSKG